MRPRLVALAALLAVALAAAPADARVKPRHAKRLTAFSSCTQLVNYAGRHVPPPVVAPPQAPVPAPAPVGGGDERAAQPVAGAPESAPAAPGASTPDTSETNNQEAGVDEPDTVKTDGDTLFSVGNGRIHATDVRSDTPKLLGQVEFKESWPDTLLLHKGRLLVIGSDPQGTRLTEIDVRNPAGMVVVRSQSLDGWAVGARLVGRSARIVVSSYPDAAYGPAELRDRPRGWLPVSTFTNRRTGRTKVRKAVDCDSVRKPASFGGPGVLSVYTIDLAKGLPAIDADAIFTSGDTVYASASSLYVATQTWDDGGFRGGTMLHRFDIRDPDKTTYAASGWVPGSLLNQFSLSEHKGILRAATTINFSESSRVTTLEQRGGYLVPRGHVGGLGEGERIYAVRFIGDVGYVVTFRQTDPLYTVDLSDPDAPKVLGELKIPGYSAYLHPVGDDLLLGVGQDADEATGRVQGLQLSLFDVSDLAAPTRLAQRKLGERYSSSAAEWDHHAFLWWPATALAVLPMQSEAFAGALGFTVDRAGGIRELGQVAHPFPQDQWYGGGIQRSLVVRGRLVTLSSYGVKTSRLADLSDGGWAAFPQAPAGPGPKLVPID